MRVGLLTYHCPPNFGAQLQAISTVGYLKRMGHEPIVLNWYAADLEEMYSKRIPADQIKCHEAFTEYALPVGVKCSKYADLIKEVDRLGLDAMVVGSDALFKYFPISKRRFFSKRKLKWIYFTQPLSCEDLEENPFFGDFLSKLTKKIPASVYAVSSQNCPYNLMGAKERKRMAEALSNYNLITVRDAWTQGMVEKITGRNNVRINPDPVFSFNQNCYLEIPSKEDILSKYNLSENYVLLSFSDWFCKSDYIKAIAEEIERRGYQPVALPMPEKLFDAGIEKKIALPLSPLEWYALIIYSKGYVGERMHPIVVCLHNSVPFFCLDEYGTKVRKSFFSRKMVYNPLSSKTYLIVKDADLLNQLYSYQGTEPLLNPALVVDRLLSFDVQKCQKFAVNKQKQYEVGIQEVIESLK